MRRKNNELSATGSNYYELLIQNEEDDGASNSSRPTFVGLENRLSDSISQDIVARRLRHQRAIRYEQDRQARVGIYDPDLLANVAEMESDWARKRATIIGLIHAECV